MLKIENLTVTRGNKIILKELNLSLLKNQIVVLYGSNGSGKTTLAQTISGNNDVKIESGKILLCQENITDLNATEKACLGIFVSSQNPPEIPGVSTLNMIKESYTAIKKTKPIAKEFLTKIKEYNNLLGLADNFYKQDFNCGASGGEKKKNELLQMLMLEPKVVILDEVDSGLDSDSKNNLINILHNFKSDLRTILVITHDQDFYKKLNPKAVYTIENQILKAI